MAQRRCLKHHFDPARRCKDPYMLIQQMRDFAQQLGSDIRPPNSPDLNLLDLGFFSAIQALQYKHWPKTIDDLIQVLDMEFDEYSSSKVNRVFFFTQQSCVVEIMKCVGGNEYRIPHLNKQRCTGKTGSSSFATSLWCCFITVGGGPRATSSVR